MMSSKPRASTSFARPITPLMPMLSLSRMVRTFRQECLDKVLILNEAHLRRVLKSSWSITTSADLIRVLISNPPLKGPESLTEGLIQKRKVLGGIINDYFRLPAQAPLPQPA